MGSSLLSRTGPFLPEAVKPWLMRSSDLFQRLRPRSRPSREKLESCRIISHRGEHDNLSIFENSLQAFERAAGKQVWGIEFDVTWSRDLYPVVHHDVDLKRLFGCSGRLRDMDLAEIKACAPCIPTLAEVLGNYGKRLHLMIEIKADAFSDPWRQNTILQAHLGDLQPEIDYHLLSLNPELFAVMNWVEPRTWVAVAELNLEEMSRIVLQRDLGGLAAHYALVSRDCLSRHQGRGQRVGTAYPDSKNCLFREINRGVDWIFSNRAGRLQSVLEEAKGKGHRA